MRRMGSLILGGLILVTLAWSGWWWFGASTQKEALQNWLAERRAAGWAAQAEVTVQGYPNRFDMVAEGLTLADPQAGWAWSAPEFRTYMLSYQPNSIIAAWPGRHRISVPGETIDATAERMRASATFAPDPGLTLDHAVVKAEDLKLDGNSAATGLDWSAAVQDGQLSIRRSEEERGRANSYDGVLTLKGFRPPEGARMLFGDRLADSLPETLEQAELDATAVFRAPIDRHAVEEGNFRPETVWLRPSVIRWGELRLEAEGRLDVAEDGTPQGRITVKAADWKRLFQAAVEAGAVPQDLVGAVEAGLGLMSRLTSDGKGLEAPLRFGDGQVFLGPIPLGESFRF